MLPLGLLPSVFLLLSLIKRPSLVIIVVVGIDIFFSSFDPLFRLNKHHIIDNATDGAGIRIIIFYVAKSNYLRFHSDEMVFSEIRNSSSRNIRRTDHSY